MRASVMNGVRAFTTKFEGQVPYMYTDALGLVTTAIGNLIDYQGSTSDSTPPASALSLPWKNEDGSPATQQEITDEWRMVKSGYPTYQSTNSKNIPGLSHLYLDNDAITNLLVTKMHENEGTLRQHFTNYDQWPADAQMGLLSMAWAMGPAFNFPSFKAATDKLDFDTAANQSQMRPSPGIAPRNAANKKLFQNAAIVQKSGGDPEVLWYPNDAVPGTNWKPYVIGGILLIAAGTGTYFALRGKA